MAAITSAETMAMITIVPTLFCTSDPTRLGTRAMMPAKMMIETPLPMPFSVISSPSQIRNIVPAAVVMRNASVGRTVRALKRPKSLMAPALASSAPCPSACSMASGTVTMRVIWLRRCRPASPPSRINSSRRGMTGCKIWMAICAVM